MKRGIILLTHGSKRDQYKTEFYKLVDKVKQKLPNDLVVGRFLNFSTSSLYSTVEKIKNKGIKKINIVPLFLFAGSHLQDDIPELVTELNNNYEEIEIELCDHIGSDMRLVELIKDRIID